MHEARNLDGGHAPYTRDDERYDAPSTPPATSTRYLPGTTYQASTRHQARQAAKHSFPGLPLECACARMGGLDHSNFSTSVGPAVSGRHRGLHSRMPDTASTGASEATDLIVRGARTHNL